MKLRVVPVILGVVLLLGNSAVFASHPSSLSATMTGGVVTPGVQAYHIKGGDVASGFVLGNPIGPMNSHIQYSVDAVVTGLAASGVGSFDFSVTGSHGNHMEVEGSIGIDSATPAVLFPLGCTFGLDCTSEIPAFFNGTAHVEVTSGGSESPMTFRIGIESPYLNPFGGNIIIASGGGEVILLANYYQGTINWTDVVMGGVVSGSAGSGPVGGLFSMVVNSSEDLKAGVERDQGMISFFGMSDPTLNAAGSFKGLSFIPTSPSIPCPGFPAGTCSMTGLNSAGMFTQTTSSGAKLSGSYSTIWTVPAVGFTSTVSASIK